MRFSLVMVVALAACGGDDVVGYKGEPGADGADGEQGPRGVEGPRGKQGSPGVDGERGDNGSPGAQGPQGPTGATGAVGPAGPQGVQGPAGAQGPAGFLTPDAIYTKQNVVQTFNNGTTAVVATCDAGDFAISGGCSLANDPAFALISSRHYHPSSLFDTPAGWFCNAYTQGSTSITAWAICVDVP